MAKVEISYPGERIVTEITALVDRATVPTTAPPPNIGLVEISQPVKSVPGPPGPPGLPGTTYVGDAPPASPVASQFWWESDTGILWMWYVDPNSAQWVQVNTVPAIAGGGGGSGDDLQTTPVAAEGSTLERTMPAWLAGAPVIEIADDVLVAGNHRGAWLHMMNPVGSYVYLPDDWPVGMTFGVRQVGTGTTQWVLTGDATMQVPFTRADHVGVSEQYEEVIFRVISNSDGGHAVWGVSGATA